MGVKVWQFFLILALFPLADSCPCQTQDLCNPIEEFPDKEVFIFSLNAENAPFYDWSKITTIVEFVYTDTNVTCLAHKNKARALSNSNIASEKLGNSTARSEWIKQQIDFVKKNYLDGINVDFESPILENDTNTRHGFTMLFKELNYELKKQSPYYMLSVDFAWSPTCIDSRCYDYASISEYVDVAFVMAYDERSQIFDECIAWSNSALNSTQIGIQKYLDLKISPEKLILGVPWYGYTYPCYKLTNDGKCYIKEVPFRGVNCSDAAGKQVNYGSIEEYYLPYSITGYLWDDTAQSPYFVYKDHDSGQLYQLWFDDPKSLSLKYKYARTVGLRGVGMWNADAIDYTNIYQINAMWGLFPSKTV